MEKYRRITSKDREEIAIGLNLGENQAAIAKKLGFEQSTISRELKKGHDRGLYNPFLAQRTTDKRAKRRIPRLKINSPTWQVIKNHLSIHWSPFQIADFLHNSPNNATIIPVSEKTIYN